MTGNALIKQLLISKADLVRACLSSEISVFGVDILKREFSQDEILKIEKEIGQRTKTESVKSEKSKKKPKAKRIVHKTPRYFADEFKIDIEEVFAVAKSFGFAIRNANYRLTERQVAVLEEQLIAREDSGFVELRLKNLEVEENSAFASALKAAFESRDSSEVAKSRNSRTEVVFVATSKISKIAKIFEVQAKVVRELCEANDIPVISERFIANDSETKILVLLQLMSVQGDEVVQVTPSPVKEKKVSNKTASVDYSGLSLTRQEVHEYDFSKSNMREVDFSYSKLSYLGFSGSQLQDSVFVQVNIKNSNFESSNLAGALFEFVVAENVDFKNANLEKASFRKAKLKNCSFSGTELSQCNFQDAELENCDFSGAVIADTKWIDGKLVQNCEDLAMYGTK